MSSVLGRTCGSVEVVLALVLVVLIRLSGGPVSFRNHPVLGPLFKVDPLYLDSLVEHLCLPPDDVVDFVLICVLDVSKAFPVVCLNFGPFGVRSTRQCCASRPIPGTVVVCCPRAPSSCPLAAIQPSDVNAQWRI